MKKIEIEIPKYYQNKGFKFNWSSGFEIAFKVEDNYGKLTANKAGLISLANHLLNLAQDEIPNKYHIHLDDYGSFEEGSSELIIEKIEKK